MIRSRKGVMGGIALVAALGLVAGLPAISEAAREGVSVSSADAQGVARHSCAAKRKRATRTSIAVTKAKKRVRAARAAVRRSEKRVSRAKTRLRRAEAAPAQEGARRRLARARKQHRHALDRRAHGKRLLRKARKRDRRAGRALTRCLDVKVPPRLLSAKARGEHQVLLTFDRKLDESADLVTTYRSTPDLFITGAARRRDLRHVVLTTGTTYAVGYRIAAPGVHGIGGKRIAHKHRTARFTGKVELKTGDGRLAGAVATGNTTVVLSFTRPMGDSVTDASHYTIAHTGAGGAVSRLPVWSARFTDDTRTEVELTVGSQSELSYQVTAAGVRDLGGAPLAARHTTPTGQLFDPASATFVGRPPANDTRADTDCDGLSDHEESAGWDVTVHRAAGGTQTRHVTSDPGPPGADCAANPSSRDTDADGLDDATEKSLSTDPRDEDTDDDGLGDGIEFNEVYSDPVVQDSDADGLTDGLELNFFRTSPNLDDTDGDQILDDVEINLSNRKPTVADLPEPALELGEMDLGLDVRFVDTTGTESTTVDEKSVSSSLVQSESKEFSSTDSRTIEASTSVSTTAGFTLKIKGDKDAGVTQTYNFSTTVENSYSTSFTSSFTESSSEATQEAREESLTSSVAKAEQANRTREVTGARMQVAMMIRTASDIAFTLHNVQVTAMIQDPQRPTRLTPVATLLPAAEPAGGFNLGPLVPERGPVIFENTQVFPKLVDDLMRNPRGLVFRLSNYDVVDELGRNFAFTSQEVNDRTAGLVIDYGGADTDGDGVGDRTEKVRIATGTGRRIDTDGDGAVDDRDRRVVYDADGDQVGITLRDALAGIGLTRYREDRVPTGTLTQRQVDESYSVEPDGSGGERIVRIRDVKVRPDIPNRWEVLTPTGIDRTLGLDDLVMTAGESYTLAFLQDQDDDRLPALVESMNGCVDSVRDDDHDGRADSSDTDGDGLDDRFEVLVGWDVTTDGGSSHVTSKCSSPDTDDDGLADGEEAPAEREYDGDGLIRFEPDHQPARDTSGPKDPDVGWALQDPITDPTRDDTDLDSLTDRQELTPYQVVLASPPAAPGAVTDPLTTSPEHFDSDHDTASDGVEKAIGGNPRDYDFENFGDSDGDGLVNVVESTPYDVEVVEMDTGSDLCDEVCPDDGDTVVTQTTSNKLDPDSDGDGLDDGEERALGTDARKPDTDGDGLSDAEEVRGFTLRDLGQIVTEPLQQDTDRDRRSDGEEADRYPKRRMIVRVDGETPYQAFSSPIDPDADLDRLVDGDEAAVGTDPANSNTDGDDRSDYSEVRMGVENRRPLVPDVRVRLRISSIEFTQDGDEGSHAGSFLVGLSAWDRNGRFPCEAQGDPHCQDFYDLGTKPWNSRYDDGPWAEALKPCPTEFYEGICRRKDPNVGEQIQTQSEFALPSIREPVLSVGSVGTANADTFSIAGFIHEYDYDADGDPFIDCRIEFPDVTSTDEDGAGILRGSDLELGTHAMNVHRSVRCAGDDEDTRETVEVTIFAAYTAD